MRLQRVRGGEWQVLAVCTDRGDCPLLEFLTGLEGGLVKDGRRTLKLLDRVALHGPARSTDISHQLGPGLWEFSQGRIRIFWFYDEGRLVVCSQGFVKKRQKIPASEIERAQEYQRRYLAAKTQADLEVKG